MQNTNNNNNLFKIIAVAIATIVGIIIALFGIISAIATGNNINTPNNTSSQSSTNYNQAIINIVGSTQKITAEIADTEVSREYGLMNRKNMGINQGMLFIFPSTQRVNFWMKNTYIPLDMVYIAEDYTINGIVKNAAPLDISKTYPSSYPVLFVLEIPAGSANQHGFIVGKKLIISLSSNHA